MLRNLQVVTAPVLHTGSTMRCDALSAVKMPLLLQGFVAHKARCPSARTVNMRTELLKALQRFRAGIVQLRLTQALALSATVGAKPDPEQYFRERPSSKPEQ